MKPFILNASDTTPHIYFDPDKDKFEFFGESRPENTGAYFEPVFKWIKEYGSQMNGSGAGKQISLNVQLDYFSSTSAKYIANMFFLFESLVAKGCIVQVLWRYRTADLQIRESGEQFQKILHIPFVFEKFED